MQVFRVRTPPEAIALVSRLLEYTPGARITPLQACAHPFFNELREGNKVLPNGREFPPLFNFTEQGESIASATSRQTYSSSYLLLELAIQPSLNASLLPRNPNDAPSNAGQSSSSQPSAGGGNVNETSSNQQSQSSLNQSDITIQTADSTTVKADASQQVQASTMG